MVGAVKALDTLSDCITSIKDITDIPHAELYEKVLEPGFTYTETTCSIFENRLNQLLSNTSYIDELREKNISLSQAFIFDGFFNKIIDSFTSEYAIQFREVVVDP